MRGRELIWAGLMGLAWLLGSNPLQAQAPSPSAAVPVPAAGMVQSGALPQTAHALTRDDAETWLDGYVPYALARGGVAGAVVVIVKDGHVLLQKGYGYADIATRKQVDPQTTLFRPGSVSKLFIWTAVMQLVEQGKLSLDRDVNSYLDFVIPPYQGQPVTMRNLMTHTAGFEETSKYLIAAEPAPEPPLDIYLKGNLPERIFPAGKIPSYSNYGATLAAYIVQRVSGQLFADYVEQHIFMPLGMQYATVRQPLPPRFKPLMASGYDNSAGAAKPFEIVGPAPAGSSSVSGADMGRFMIAHLQDGQLDGQQILKPETARMMHSTALNNLPPLNSMLLGFYQMNRNGHRIIGHGGDTQWFHSEVSLFLDDNVGLFISLNSLGVDGAAGPIRQALREEFADRYFPGSGVQGHVDEAAAGTDAARLAGSYISSRREETSFFSLLYYLMEETPVAAEAHGKIASPDLKDMARQPMHFDFAGPYIWRADRGQTRVAAKLEGGDVAFWGNDDAPFEVFTPVPWYKNGVWLKPALGASLGALLLTAIFWPVTALYRRRYGAALALHGTARLSYRLTRAAALIDVLLMIAWPATVLIMFQTFALNGEFDPLLETLHILSVIFFPLAALVLLWNVWIVWSTRSGFRAWFARVWSVVLAAAGLVLAWIGVVFHLIGFSLKY
jgi:CubicO group peptidase (beta-lactamase class C family)